MDGAERADRSHADTYRLCQVGGECRINDPNQAGRNRWGGTQPTSRCSIAAASALPHAGCCRWGPLPFPSFPTGRAGVGSSPSPGCRMEISSKELSTHNISKAIASEAGSSCGLSSLPPSIPATSGRGSCAGERNLFGARGEGAGPPLLGTACAAEAGDEKPASGFKSLLPGQFSGGCILSLCCRAGCQGSPLLHPPPWEDTRPSSLCSGTTAYCRVLPSLH